MPKKAKDKIIEIQKNIIPKVSEILSKSTKKKTASTKNIAKNSTTKNSTAKKENTDKKSIAKTAKKENTDKKNTAKTAKKESTSTKKKTATKKVAAIDKEKNNTVKSSKASNSAKKLSSKSSSAKTSGRKSTTKKVANRSIKKSVAETTSKPTSSLKKNTAKSNLIGEYYDLPAHYENTIVKILAQTPTILFVYWDISSQDRNKFIAQYGEDFFENTSPYLLIKNITKNYQYEVDVNDYANSWYLHIPDSNCEYEVLLMRRSNNYQIVPENNIYITSSNQLETPNDHILFERLGKNIFFQNVKNGHIISKDISSFAFMHNIGRIYNIYDLYKEIYKNELNGDELGVTLSSSQFSSNFK